MSDYAASIAVIRRESETEKKIRAMDALDIVELVHGLEDAIDELETKARVLTDALDAIAEADPDECAGRLRDIANEALATTEGV